MTKKTKFNWQEGDYFVEKIIDSRFNAQKKCMQYKVKWVGYPMDQCTWEPSEHLQNVKDMIEKYMKQKRQKLKLGNKIKMSREEESIEEELERSEQSLNKKIKSSDEKLKSLSKKVHKVEPTSNIKSRRQRVARNEGPSTVNNKKREKSQSDFNEKFNDQQIQDKYQTPKNHVDNYFGNSQEQIGRYIANQAFSIEGVSENKSLQSQNKIQQFRLNALSKNIDKPIQDNSYMSEQMGMGTVPLQNSFEILGMSKNKMDLMFHVYQKGAQRWVNRSQIIDKRAKQICEFYEQNLVFLRDEIPTNYD